MQINKKEIESVNNIYLNLTKLLEGKIRITEGELLHIKRSINYIIKKEEIKYRETETEFIKNCKQIIDGLDSLREKINNSIDDLEKIENFLTEISTNILQNNNYHLELILKLDCIQSRTLIYAEKLEYLNRAFENLIGPYNAQYLPMPSVSKRIKTSSLMLYFNKNLNEIANNLKKDFFEIETNVENNQKSQNITHRIFTTWEFSSYEHLKSIDDEKQTFAALSFWFYEKQVLYPIAFHEITHSIYMRKNFHEKIKDIKLTDKEKNNIASNLLMETDKDITSSMIYTVYQDIVADFCAYSVAGASYIFSLFFTGFMRNLHLNFYKDLIVKSQKKQQNIDNEEKKCLKRHEKLTLLNWNFGSNNSDNDFVSFYIRIMLLVKLHMLQIKNNNENIFQNELNAIINILNFIYPNDYYLKEHILIKKENKLGKDDGEEKGINISTFEDIMRIHDGRYNQYKYAKNFTLLFLNLMDTLVFEKKRLQNRVNLYIQKHSKKFKNNNFFQEIIQKNNETMHLNQYYDNYNSEYDLFWKKRFIDIDLYNQSKNQEKFKSKYLGRLLRLYNLSKILQDELDTNIKLKDRIYELVFFKFQIEEHIFVDFVDNGIHFNNIKNSFRNESKAQISYAFGPFDISILTKSTSKQVDNYLDKLSKKIDFFTERHALILLCDIINEKPHINYFDISMSIDMQGEFQDKDDNENPKNNYILLKNKLEKLHEHEKISFESIKIFASLGNENYIVYITNINIQDFNTIISETLSLDKIKNINTNILLKNNSKDKLNCIKINKREIVLLCKVNKKRGIPYNDIIDKIKEQIENLTKSSNNKINIYKKFGIYDLIIIPKNSSFEEVYKIIKENSEYLSDVQIELQIE